MENKCRFCGSSTGVHDYGEKKGEPFELCVDCNEKFNNYEIIKCPKCGEYIDFDVIDSLKAVKSCLSQGVLKTITYHDQSESQEITGKAVEACQKIDCLFESIIDYFKSKRDNDKSACKAELIHLTEFFSKAVMFTDDYLALSHTQSSIETLLLEALTITRPSKFQGKVFLHSQVDVCDGDFTMDIALCDINSKILLGIECDGYGFHYSDAKDTTKTLNRVNEIKMREKIEVLQYSGSAIYSDCIGISNKIWKYLEETFAERQI